MLHDGLDRESGDGKAPKFLEKFFLRKHHVTALVRASGVWGKLDLSPPP
jgi:hypothetical protein